MRKCSESLLETLLRVMPELRDKISVLPLNAKTTEKAASLLYDMWKEAEDSPRSYKIRPPSSLKKSDIKVLEDEGLVVVSSDDLNVTKKGKTVLKEMILGDNSSALDKEKKESSYRVALASAYDRKRIKTGKKYSSASSSKKGWYWECQR